LEVYNVEAASLNRRPLNTLQRPKSVSC
jgi:hypothetical protein